MIIPLTTLGAYGGPVSGSVSGEYPMTVMLFQVNLAGPISQNFVPPFPSQRCQSGDDDVSVVVQVLDSLGAPVNLRVASDMIIVTQRPSGVVVETKGSFYTNGLDGKMTFNSGSAVPYGTGLDEPGIWMIQAKVTLDGNTSRTDRASFFVGPNLGEERPS